MHEREFDVRRILEGASPDEIHKWVESNLPGMTNPARGEIKVSPHIAASVLTWAGEVFDEDLDALVLAATRWPRVVPGLLVGVTDGRLSPSHVSRLIAEVLDFHPSSIAWLVDSLPVNKLSDVDMRRLRERC